LARHEIPAAGDCESVQKRIRTALHHWIFTVALFLFGLLVICRRERLARRRYCRPDRLVIINKTSMIQPCPLSIATRLLRDRTASKQVNFPNWFGRRLPGRKEFLSAICSGRGTPENLVSGVQGSGGTMAGFCG